MKKTKFLILALVFSNIFSANAQEVAVPDVINKLPEKSIEVGQANDSNAVVIKQEDQSPTVEISLMFSRATSAALETAVTSYVENSLLNQNGTAVNQKPLVPDVKQIYLGSVIYRTGKESLAWVNGQKFAIGETKEALTITDINKEDVTVKWNLGDLVLAPKEEMQKTGLMFEDKPGNRSITFNLKLNQRLDVQKLKVLSGKLPGSLAVPKILVRQQAPSFIQDTPLEGTIAEEFMDIPAPKMNVPPALQKISDDINSKASKAIGTATTPAPAPTPTPSDSPASSSAPQ